MTMTGVSGRIAALVTSALVTAALLMGASAQAQETAVRGESLVIGGQLEEGQPVILDMAALQALPVSEFETSTIWTDGVRRFTGVALADLLEAVGADGKVIRAVAVNDYAVEIPVSDAVPGGPIVAYHMDGAPMPLRDKGPFWIVYPYDSDSDYRSEVIYSRSIWQLATLEVGG